MIELILRLPSLRVLDKLLPMIQQLQIPYQTRTIEEPVTNINTDKEDIFVKIQNGDLDIPNFEQFMVEFEKSRQDRKLPSRD